MDNGNQKLKDFLKKQFRSPFANGMIAAVVILLLGFMTYHFVAYQMTQLAAISNQQPVSLFPTPTVIPTVTQMPSTSPSPYTP